MKQNIVDKSLECCYFIDSEGPFKASLLLNISLESNNKINFNDRYEDIMKRNTNECINNIKKDIELYNYSNECNFFTSTIESIWDDYHSLMSFSKKLLEKNKNKIKDWKYLTDKVKISTITNSINTLPWDDKVMNRIDNINKNLLLKLIDSKFLIRKFITKIINDKKIGIKSIIEMIKSDIIKINKPNSLKDYLLIGNKYDNYIKNNKIRREELPILYNINFLEL